MHQFTVGRHVRSPDPPGGNHPAGRESFPRSYPRRLCGQFTQVYHLHDERKVIAFHRWDKGGAADDVVVVANFFRDPQDGYVIGFPAAGVWKLRFNSDWQGYSDDFQSHPSSDIVAEAGETDGLPCYAAVSLGSYSVLVYSL